MKNSPQISLVVPVFNEEDAIPIFIKTVCSELCSKYDNLGIVFVDDGSTDNTFEVIKEFMSDSENIDICCIRLSRNFGKEAALSAGLDHTTGDVVIPMDVDLQDPPFVIHEFIHKWHQGFDVVYGVREDRGSDSVVKRLTSGLFYRLFNNLSGTGIPRDVGDFRLMDKRVVNVIRELPERNRFMKGLFSWVGFKSIGVPYTRPERSAGNTKWNYWKLWNYALDGITSFTTIPLRVWTYIGVFISSLSFFYLIVLLVYKFLNGIALPGYASLMSAVLFLGGVQLMSLGIVGEYVGRLYVEIKRRPNYVVDVIVDKNMLGPEAEN